MVSSSAPEPSVGRGSSPEPAPVVCRLSEILAERGMTMTHLSQLTGITMANLSLLKNDNAKAIRLRTLALLCDALEVSPGELLVVTDPRPSGRSQPWACTTSSSRP